MIVSALSSFAVQGTLHLLKNEEWTILDGNSLPVLTFNSFISLEASAVSQSLEYPVEMGTFSSYNKVIKPCEMTVTLAIQNSNRYKLSSTNLQDALATLEVLRTTTQKVSIVTPYEEFKYYSLESYDWASKIENGVDLLIFPLTFREVREVEPLYSNGIKFSKNPSATSKEKLGKVNLKSILFEGKDKGIDFLKSIRGY